MTACGRRDCIETNTQSIDCAKYKAHGRAGMTALNADHPLAADANALGQGRLVEPKLFSPVTNDGSEVGRRAYEHGISQMLSIADISICHRSLTIKNVIDR